MKYISYLKKNSFNEILILVLISLHIFFWDIKFISNYGFRESVSLILVFLIFDLIKKKFIFSDKIIKKLIVIVIFLFIITVHLFFNVLIDNGIFYKENILALLGISTLSIIIFFYYDLIVENLNLIISFFLIFFLLGFFISDYKFLTEWERNYSGICYGNIKIKHFIFAENSHLGMMIGGILGYLTYYCKEKNYIFIIIINLLILGILILFPSLTVFFAVALTYVLILIYDFKFFFKKLFILVSIIFAVLFFFNFHVNCKIKILETYQVLNVVETNVFQEDEDEVKAEESKKKVELLNKNNFGTKNFLIDQRVNKGKRYLGPTKQFPKLFNLTTAVFVNALNISFETLKNRYWGWGINRYESAFDYYMFNNIVVPYFYHEVYTLNYNDGSGNLPKLISEFGIFSFLIVPIFFIFMFTKKLSINTKVFFLLIFGLQLLRGAGYFNGGFSFSLIIMLYTIFDLRFKKNK